MTDDYSDLCRALVQELPIGVVVWRLEVPEDDGSLRLLGSNNVASTMVGSDLSLLVGHFIRDVFPLVTPERQATYAEIIRSAAPKSLGEITYGDARVTPSSFSVTAIPLPNMCLATLFENLTVRKQREKEIRRLHAFMDAIVENMPAMVFVKDAQELRFELLNRSGEGLLGVPRTDLLGKTDFDLFPKDQAEFFQGKDREVLRGGTVLSIPEEKIDTAAGPRWLLTRKVPILDENGTAQHLLGISLDITARDRKSVV